MKVYVLAALVALVACDKGNGTEPAKGSPAAAEVKLSPDEAAMLASLPSGNVALFGGNLMRFQKYLADSPLSRVMGAMTQSTGQSMAEWMNCFVEPKNIQMLGAVKLDNAAHVDMRIVMSGMQLSQLEACAKRAGFPTQMDADQKYLAVDFPNLQGPVKNGYLVVAGGMLYSRVSMQFPNAIATDRTMLEADITSLSAKGSAATDKALVSQIGSVDRSKAMWFVGSAAGTPIADKLGTVHGTFDIANGITVDVTAQVKDKAMANQIADGVASAKKQAASMGPAIQPVIEKLQFNRSGEQLRMQISIDNAQLNALVDQITPFMPKAAGAR